MMLSTVFTCSAAMARWPGHGIHAVVGKRGRHHREIARTHKNGALPEIEVEVLHHRPLDHAGIELEISNGTVTVAGRTLGLEHRIVDASADARHSG